MSEEVKSEPQTVETQETPKNDQNDSSNIFEGRKFDWWSEKGTMHSLFRMNKLRVPMVQDTLLGVQGDSKKESGQKEDDQNEKPLRNFKIIDVGCGGGLMCEPLAALGADVTGIDVSKESIEAAEEHLKQESASLEANLKYIHCSIEDFANRSETPQFDAAIASEVAEHVPDLEKFIVCCGRVVKPGGYLFITTINQTVAAYLRYILLDEKILRVLPQGTHPYRMLVPIPKLKKILEDNDFTVTTVRGMMSNPLSKTWSWTRHKKVNYFLVAQKNENKPVDESKSESQ